MELEQRISERYAAIKALLTLLVVVGHVTIMYTSAGALPPAVGSTAVGVVGRYLYSFHMPLFFLISGSVYALCCDRPGGYPAGPRMILSKAKRLLVPYVVFGVFYVTPVVRILRLTPNSFTYLLYRTILLSINPRHLWFLLALFWIYVLSALARWIAPRVFRHWASIPVVLALAVCANLWYDRLGWSFQFYAAASYFVYFYLGELLWRLQRRFRFAAVPWYLGIPAGLATLLIYKEDVLPVKLLRVVLMLVFLLWLTDWWCRKGLTRNRIYRLFSDTSFGVFLFHPMIVYVIFWFLGPRNVSPVVLVPLCLAVTLPASVGLTLLVRRLRLGWILGEKKR